MKTSRLAAAAVVAVSFWSFMASGACAADPVDPAADAAWKHLDEIKTKLSGDAPKGENEVDYFTPIKVDLGHAATQFVAEFPDDPHRWDAQLLIIRAQIFPAAADERAVIFAHNEKMAAEILAAPGASAEVKQATERKIITQHLDHLDLITSPEQALALEARITDYLGRHPDDPNTASMELRRVDLWRRVDPAKADSLLAEMAASSDPKLATGAQGRQAQAGLASSALDWKLAGLDGQPIDFTALRGKVVVVDFWASWCPDCMREMPEVLAAFKKYHDRGLEVVGISLDTDRDALVKTLKKRDLPWPQFFDDKGWKTDLAERYGIKGIPDMWLVDPAGHVVATGLEADQLDAKIAALLPTADGRPPIAVR